ASDLNLNDDPLSQVTSVSELRDVQPTDWAYTALENLVVRYGCIAGYPDGTYRGNTAMSRYEFAAGLNACLGQISGLIEANQVSREDIQILQRLMDEFGAELANLRRDTDALEALTAELEANQFSTTTKLRGEAIFDVTDRFGGDDSPFLDGAEFQDNTVFRDRVRLNLVTSFTGEDELVTRLAAGNVSPFTRPGPYDLSFVDRDASTAEGLLAQRVGGNTGNDLELDTLSYTFSLGDRTDIYVSAARGRHEDYAFTTFNDYLDDGDGGQGAISTFGQRSPIYRIGGGTGAGVNVALTSDYSLVLTGGYLADEAASPSDGSGLFNGDYAALGQLTFAPGDRFKVGATYVRGYHTENNFIFDSGFGDEFFVGNVPANATHIVLETAATTNSYGLQAYFQPIDAIALNAFGGFTDIDFREAGKGSGDIWYYGLGLSFPDLLAEGNLGGIVVGVEPYLAGESSPIAIENATSVHVEGFYRYQVNDHIAITPGIIWISAPEQNDNNDGFVVGTLRTTFRF
ncbi:MAG: iron uptake porin, partial [Cyanobacteria bacterium P01_A01_bin.135]